MHRQNHHSGTVIGDDGLQYRSLSYCEGYNSGTVYRHRWQITLQVLKMQRFSIYIYLAATSRARHRRQKVVSLNFCRNSEWFRSCGNSLVLQQKDLQVRRSKNRELQKTKFYVTNALSGAVAGAKQKWQPGESSKVRIGVIGSINARFGSFMLLKESLMGP